MGIHFIELLMKAFVVGTAIGLAGGVAIGLIMLGYGLATGNP